MRYPKKLEVGATVGLIAPSSPISSERMEKCISAVESQGYKVRTADNLTQNYAGFMAGDGEVRAKWINSMFADPEVDAIFCIRGGYAGNRAMEYLDLETIKNNPKIFVGYSDVTSMHLAINQSCNFVTFHGPMVSSNMVDEFDNLTKESFFKTLNAEEKYEFKNPQGQDIKVLKEGKATGEITGGNLAILCSSMGTEYEINTKGKILFIEDVGETISRIDRMAYQLLNSGKLKDCAGIILGQFTECSNDEVPEYTEIECFADAMRGIDVPVMYNIQSGHDHPMMTLPLGGVCTMDTFKKTLVFEAPER
ncbi:S66 peptidase family protein [Proteocatella sphenisci]|uniref:S66 peptidase family protein n=1 Tax=Proteocatella sphenisci TaxID=181070 RepID=UPI00048F2497|nr:LD-carboxypeptidase [Proteocatella sphenisci]